MSVGLRATGDSDLLSCLRASRASLRSNEDTGSRMKQNERPGMWLRARVGGGESADKTLRVRCCSRCDGSITRE